MWLLFLQLHRTSFYRQPVNWKLMAVNPSKVWQEDMKLPRLCVLVCVLFTSGCPAVSSVWTRWRPPSERSPSSPYCTVHTGWESLAKRHTQSCKSIALWGAKCVFFVQSDGGVRHLRCLRTRAPVLVWCCCSLCSGCSWTAGCWPSCVSCSPQPVGTHNLILANHESLAN